MLRIGIVGLAQVGKTTLFQILTRAHGGGQGTGRPEAHVGIVRVPDARLDRLVEMFQRQKIIHATIEYVDTPGSIIELARAGVQSQNLRELNALMHVVRAFQDQAIPAEGGAVNPQHDIENVELELMLSDLAMVENVNLLFFHATVEQFVDPSTFGMIGPGSNYLGGGTIAKLNGFLLQTKRFAPFYEAGSQCRVGMIDFLFDKTTNGEITSDIFVDEDSSTSMTDESINTSLQGSNIVRTRPENLNLYPFQSKQDKIWHRQIIESIAQNFQIQLSMSDIQLANFETSEAEISFQMPQMFSQLSYPTPLKNAD